uniref:G_PROTEIN_RECEP_F1_2 domain-containing protein n=1 Tax=Strongyloides venezuelensis TaxID=75913 RepID=A0A0K0FB24_STRVS
MKIAYRPLLNSTIAASVIGCTYTVINRYFSRFNEVANNLSDKERKKKLLMMLYMVEITTCLVILFIEQFAGLVIGIVKYEYGTYITPYLLY